MFWQIKKTLSLYIFSTDLSEVCFFLGIYSICNMFCNMFFNESIWKHSLHLLTCEFPLDDDFLFPGSTSLIPKYSGYKDFMVSSVMDFGFFLYLLQAVFISSTTVMSVSTKWTSRKVLPVPNCCIPMMYARAHNLIGTKEFPLKWKKTD